jgi:hypothetical protein
MGARSRLGICKELPNDKVNAPQIYKVPQGKCEDSGHSAYRMARDYPATLPPEWVWDINAPFLICEGRKDINFEMVQYCYI